MLARHTRPPGGRWSHNWNWIVFRIRDFSTIGNSINWFLPGPMELLSPGHLLTHSLTFTYYAKLTEISEIQQIHNPTGQFNWTPTVTIFYCQKLYWVVFQFLNGSENFADIGAWYQEIASFYFGIILIFWQGPWQSIIAATSA